MGASFRANQMSVHAETARNRRDGWTDRQTAFRLYIVDNATLSVCAQNICRVDPLSKAFAACIKIARPLQVLLYRLYSLNCISSCNLCIYVLLL